MAKVGRWGKQVGRLYARRCVREGGAAEERRQGKGGKGKTCRNDGAAQVRERAKRKARHGNEEGRGNTHGGGVGTRQVGKCHARRAGSRVVQRYDADVLFDMRVLAQSVHTHELSVTVQSIIILPSVQRPSGPPTTNHNHPTATRKREGCSAV